MIYPVFTNSLSLSLKMLPWSSSTSYYVLQGREKASVSQLKGLGYQIPGDLTRHSKAGSGFAQRKTHCVIQSLEKVRQKTLGWMKPEMDLSLHLSAGRPGIDKLSASVSLSKLGVTIKLLMVAHFAQRLDMVNSSESNHCYLLTKAVIRLSSVLLYVGKKWVMYFHWKLMELLISLFRQGPVSGWWISYSQRWTVWKCASWFSLWQPPTGQVRRWM